MAAELPQMSRAKYCVFGSARLVAECGSDGGVVCSPSKRRGRQAVCLSGHGLEWRRRFLRMPTFVWRAAFVKCGSSDSWTQAQGRLGAAPLPARRARHGGSTQPKERAQRPVARPPAAAPPAADGPQPEKARGGCCVHRDGSVLSFNILLNSAAAFRGGGTFMEATGTVHSLQRGDCFVHSGKASNVPPALQNGFWVCPLTIEWSGQLGSSLK